MPGKDVPCRAQVLRGAAAPEQRDLANDLPRPERPPRRLVRHGQNASQKTANLRIVRHSQEAPKDRIPWGNFSIRRQGLRLSRDRSHGGWTADVIRFCDRIWSGIHRLFLESGPNSGTLQTSCPSLLGDATHCE